MADFRPYFVSTSTAEEVTSVAGRKLGELASTLQRYVAVGGGGELVMSGSYRFRVGGTWEQDVSGRWAMPTGTRRYFTTQIVGVGGVGNQVITELKKIDETLVLVRGHVREALARGGLNEELADVLIDYVDMKVSTEKAVADIVAEAERELAARRDPADALSAAELAAVLGVTDETVRNREAAGELFSILRPGRKRGREYPVFQTWEGVAGEPLKGILGALGRPSGPVAYAFFTSEQDTLAGLSPLEALVGLTPREVSPEAQEFLRSGAPERLAVVVQAAQTYASSLAA
jgi:hypothetical protein